MCLSVTGAEKFIDTQKSFKEHYSSDNSEAAEGGIDRGRRGRQRGRTMEGDNRGTEEDDEQEEDNR